MKKDTGFDVAALGELLIDFTENGLSAQGNSLFEANPGGAPCNVLAMLKKLGHSCAFIGKAGDDILGRQLRQVAVEAGIDMTHLVMDQESRTTLAFVKTAPNGDREFSFFRNPGADMLLTQEEIPQEVVENCGIFHFGTLSMTHEGVRQATCQAIDWAKNGGALLSFDPNLRPPLWESLEEAKRQIGYGLGKCDILKIADNEIEFMTGETDFYKAAVMLREKYPNIRLLNVTAGSQGSYSYYKDHWVFVPALQLGGTIETTGAGDTFCACVLHYVLTHRLEGLTEENLREMLSFANAAAYLVTTKKGAIKSMPEQEEVEALL